LIFIPGLCHDSVSFVLGEGLHPLQAVGGMGVIAAVILLQMAKEKTAPATPLDIRQKD
jgi:drug/metabolite transporter (DMT)-like permease